MTNNLKYKVFKKRNYFDDRKSSGISKFHGRSSVWLSIQHQSLHMQLFQLMVILITLFSWRHRLLLHLRHGLNGVPMEKTAALFILCILAWIATRRCACYLTVAGALDRLDANNKMSAPVSHWRYPLNDVPLIIRFDREIVGEHCHWHTNKLSYPAFIRAN